MKKTVVEESKLLDQRKYDLFQNNNLYESAPQSASIVSPKRDLPSINPPYSAPLLAETYHDIVSVENLIREENVSCKTHQNYTEIKKSRESPHSEISGIEELSFFPVRVFSDSSVSCFPDSEEDRCFEKKRRVDMCAGQSRNQFITAFLVHLIQRMDGQLKVIEQKYLESGHTHMEVDSMHSAIERQQRHTPVYSMIDWKSIMERARSKRNRDSAPPYTVKELKYTEMVDVRALNEKIAKNTSRDKEGNKITWLKIKCLRFERKKPGSC
ncbi:unnamed protein product [Parnassius apollo]|uniref:(apollo) hypothetical protein n=1 Tax=Parnassius apollo TaxID=110799 RepID=A0A8S3WDH1_PARAO|nr:unnamed protein product [Parnassius apollo]